MKKKSLLLAWVLGVSSAFGAGQVGEQAHDWLNLTDLDTNVHHLPQYRGKVVFLFTVQHNCGGCLANAPRIGIMADTIAKGRPFQAMGVDVNVGTVAQLRTFENTLKSQAPDVDFPLLRGVTAGENGLRDSNTTGGSFVGRLWIPYNALRDVFFVIDPDGKIVHRHNGNRINATADSNFQAIETALNAALDAATISLAPAPWRGQGFRMERVAEGYRFHVDDGNFGIITMQILDIHGRVLRGFNLSPARSEVVWNGTDAGGNPLPYGIYFLRAKADGISFSRRIPLLP